MKKSMILFVLIFFINDSFASDKMVIQRPELSVFKSSLVELLINKRYSRLADSLTSDNKSRIDLLVANTLEREIERIEETRGVIHTNNFYSTIIFWIIHFALLIGLVASIVEFVQSYKLRKLRINTQMTEITVKMEELAIKSTSTGIMILVISLVFYFLYLKFVHQIIVI